MSSLSKKIAYILAKSNFFYKSATQEISLTEKESKLFGILMEVVKEKAPSTILRVAGGWVRDKLLGKDSNDIDIAINNMSGEAFANLVSEYMQEHGLSYASGTVTVIKANPQQSKHLATATMKVLGESIDFVNLRSESYSDDSRIPEVRPGTALEDAERRDLTINSMFYNINEGKVEDLVGGKQDLQNRIARTPMDPVKTFLDDPLRILRTVRFAAKYDLKLDPSLIAAARDPRVQDAFKNKVSNERVWVELGGKKEPVLDDSGKITGFHWKPGAMIGPNPHRAAELLDELGLLDIVFSPSEQEMQALNLKEEMVPWGTEQDNPHHDLSIWHHTLATLKNLVEKTESTVREDQEAFLIRNIAALLHDIGKRYKGIQGKHEKGFTTYHGHEEISAKMAEQILNRIKAPKDIVDRVVRLIDKHLSPHVLTENSSPKAKRKFHKELGDDWRHSIDLARADALGKKVQQNPEEIAGRYDQLAEGIQGLTIANPKLTRSITGNDLIQLGFKPGPIMRDIFKKIDDELLENPEMTKEEALEIAKTFM